MGSRRENVIVLSVRMSLSISAAECAASANNDDECDMIPPTALTTTNAKFTSLDQSRSGDRRVQSNSSNPHTGVRYIF